MATNDDQRQHIKWSHLKVILLMTGCIFSPLFWSCDDTPMSRNDDMTVEDMTVEDMTVEDGLDQSAMSDDLSLADVQVEDSEFDHGLDMYLASPLSDQVAGGIFRQGCPKMGFAHARILQGSGELTGESVIADQGDLLLMNDRVAYVVQDPTQSSRTWWYYGGQIVDAVPIKDCVQADEDRLNSLGMVVGEGDVTALDQAVMRAFKGERFEIIHDGQGGGAARVRVYGRDAPMWLVEAELLGMALKAGRPKLKSEELGVEMWVDYILPPDESVIQIEISLTNLLGEPRTLRMSALTFFGDKAYTQRFSSSQLNLGGIRLFTGLPWLSSGNMALSLDSNNMATAHFAGVDLFIDVTRFVTGDRLGSLDQTTFDLGYDERVEQPDSTSWSMGFSVHEEGLSHAASALAAHYPNPALGRSHIPFSIPLHITYGVNESETIRSPSSEVQVAVRRREARIELWVVTENEAGTWVEMGQLGEQRLKKIDLISNEEISLLLPGLLKMDEHYQLRIWIPGVPELRSDPFIYDAQEGLPLGVHDVVLPSRGLLELSVQDDTGQEIPATLRLTPIAESTPLDLAGYQAYPNTELIHIIEHIDIWLSPGRYKYTLTRGYEYEPIQGELEVISGQVTREVLTLQHLNPIKNYLSFDGHVHAGPSPDSDILIKDRLRGATAEGLDIVAGSDHEIITDWKLSMGEQLRPWILPIIAEESTATLPEHMNIYPLEPRSDTLRGDPPRWYGLGFDRFTDILEERGAQVIQLNHPRQGCNYLCLIGYDRETGEPDPTLNTLNFGYDEGELWGWGFNAVELLNDPRPIFMSLDQPESTGFYEDWASFINLGHPATGMGVSDVHGPDGIGVPVTLLKLTEGDVVAKVTETSPNMVGEAIVQGRAQVSLGAWVELDINGADLGELALPNLSEMVTDTFDLSLTVRAVPSVDVSWVYLFVNCDLAYSWEAQAPFEVIKHEQELRITLEEDAWVTVMAFGDDEMPAGLPNYDPRVTPRVVTNPIYLDGDGDGSWTAPGGKTCLIPEGRRP